MNLLDAIVEGMDYPQDFPAMTPYAYAVPDMYKGLASEVGEYSGTQDLLRKLKLDWKVCEMPVYMQGTAENRLFPNKKALVRCDTGDPIDIVSSVFKVHQNEEILAGMVDVIDRIGAKVTKGGYIPDSGRVFLEAKALNTFNIGKRNLDDNPMAIGSMSNTGSRVGDILDLEFIVTGGHKPGTPRKIKAIAKRLSCSNSATILAAIGQFDKISHRTRITAETESKAQMAMAVVVEEFERYGVRCRALASIPATKAIQQAYLLRVVEPDLLGRIVNQQMLSGMEILSEIIERDEQFSRADGDWLLRCLDGAKRRGEDVKVPRIFRTINGVLDTQPGEVFTRGTLANAYHAVTYYVDHVSGRHGSQAAIESAMDGNGDRLKQSAFDAAIEFGKELEQIRG